MNLYEINAEIMACVDEETGEIIDTVKLDQLQMVFGEKVEGIALYIKNLAAEAAAIKAIEVVDECVGKAVDAIKEVDGQLFICADHGNCEQLIDYETGEPYTAHTTNPVPFILVNYDPAYTLREGGCLADIAPTLIEMMGMEQPAEMTGKSLLIKK